MKSFAYTLICLFAFSILGFGQTTTVTLEPTDDVYLQNGKNRNNTQLQLKHGKQNVYLKFDLSHINGEITNAKLLFTSISKSTRSILEVYEGDNADWVEDDLDYSSRPIRNTDDPIGTFDGSSTFEEGEVINIELSPIWENENTLSLIVQRASGRVYNYSGTSNLTIFASKEHENETYHPQLILEIDGTVDDGGDDDDDNPTDDDDGDDNGGDDDNDDGNNSTGQSIWDIKEDGTVYYNGGNVGIGTDNPITKFVVDGEIRATKVRVRGDVNLPDYVFEEDYNLRPLEEVETYIDQNGHLPEVPSAAQVEKEGLSLGDMDATLLKKVEELTLYLIEMKKANEELKKEVEALKEKLKN